MFGRDRVRGSGTISVLLVLLLAGTPMGFAQPTTAPGPPADCAPSTYRTHWAYQQHPGVRQQWDAWSAQTKGVCVMDPPDRRAPADDCSFTAERPQLTAGGLHSGDLCWWGKSRSTGTRALTQGVSSELHDGLAKAALRVAAVQELVGKGTVHVEVRTPSHAVLVTFRDGAAAQIQGKGAPPGCTPIEQETLGRFAAAAGEAAAGLAGRAADADGTCLMLGPVPSGTCSRLVPLHPLGTLCFWRAAGLPAPDYLIQTSDDLLRALANAEDPARLVERALVERRLVVSTDAFFRQAGLKIAMGRIGDLVEVGPLPGPGSPLQWHDRVSMLSSTGRDGLWIAPLPEGTLVANGYGIPIGFQNPGHQAYLRELPLLLEDRATWLDDLPEAILPDDAPGRDRPPFESVLDQLEDAAGVLSQPPGILEAAATAAADGAFDPRDLLFADLQGLHPELVDLFSITIFGATPDSLGGANLDPSDVADAVRDHMIVLSDRVTINLVDKGLVGGDPNVLDDIGTQVLSSDRDFWSPSGSGYWVPPGRLPQ